MAPDARSTKLFYAKNSEKFKNERPYMVLTSFEGLEQERMTNLEWEAPETESIVNVRGNEAQYTLDSHGFEFFKHQTSFTDWVDRYAVEHQFLPEIEELLKIKVEGADEVQIFDWRLRKVRNECRSRNAIIDMNNPTDALSPALFVHLDQSPSGVLKRVRLLNGAKAKKILHGRVRVINAWLPILPVEDWPLALCDGSTMTYDDLIGVDLIRKDYIGSTMYAKYRPGFKWYYLDQQLPSEICLFKNFDSDVNVKAPFCSHVSFAQDNAPSSSSPRQSIEVRAFVYTNPS